MLSDISDDTGWKTLNSDIMYRRIGKLVYVRGNSSSTSIGSSGLTVGTLPSGFRPSERIDFSSWGKGGSSPVQGGYITTSGSITIYSNSNTIYWAFNVTFFI